MIISELCGLYFMGVILVAAFLSAISNNDEYWN